MRALISIIALSLVPGLAAAQVRRGVDPIPLISLRGSGEVSLPPDSAVVILGVANFATTPGRAMNENAASMARTIDAVKRNGVRDADITTSSLNLNPAEEDDVKGYRVTNAVTATLRDVKKAGPVLDSTISAGANTIQGINFDVLDAGDAQDTARKKAMADLAERVEFYRNAGLKIGRMINFSESVGSSANPIMRLNRAGPAYTPVQAGEITISATVSADYELLE